MIIVSHVEREDQKRLFALVLDHLAEMNELPINKLIEVLEDGSIHQRDWFEGDFDPEYAEDPVWNRPVR